LAIEKYTVALNLLNSLLLVESDPDARAVLELKRSEYVGRIGVLRQAVTQAQFPSIPGSPAVATRPLPQAKPVGVTSSGGTRPLPNTQALTPAQPAEPFTAVDGAIVALQGAKRLNELDNEYKVTATVGTAVVSAATTAYELDQQYKIHETIGTAVVTGVNKAVEIDQEYKVHETIGNAIVAAYDGAVALNEEHKIVEKTSLALQNGWEQTKQFNEEYKVTENIAAGLEAGWEATKQFNEEYKVTDQIGDALAAGWTWFAASVAPAPAAGAPGAPVPANGQ